MFIVTGGALHMERLTIKDCAKSKNGGVVYASGALDGKTVKAANVSFTACTLVNNSACHSEGGTPEHPLACSIDDAGDSINHHDTRNNRQHIC